MRPYKVKSKRELRECDEFLAQHGPINGPPASTQQATWAIRVGGELTAVGCARLGGGEAPAELTNCAVHPNYRGLNYQAVLLRVRAAWAKRRGAKNVITHTWTTNVPSMINLIKAGFEPTCVEGEYISFRKVL